MKIKRHVLLLLSVVCLSCTRADFDPFATIKGTVIDDSTGVALPAVGVALTPPPACGSLETNEDGQYEFTGLDPDNYTVRVWKDGYEPNSKKVNAISGKTEIVDFRLKKNR